MHGATIKKSVIELSNLFQFTTICAVKKLGVVDSFYDSLCCQKTEYCSFILRKFVLSEN